MTVEDRRGGMDHFPVGLRVLAVDDDPVCLRMLEVLLQRCQYNVTTTNQAITALKMLRENRDKFDLVISDVQMPDMDGFKLLELVGLEMDLPVIMMSGNGDTQNVMKGIAHGACDYLLKPVRIEELKNIWQHVIRRKKFDNKDHSIVAEGEDDQKVQNDNSGSDHGATDNGNLNKKRKEQGDENDGEDNIQGIEENATQKKPRVVWTIDLHRKFVTAVNQLGIDKAVPKKILDHMNVENLTRENVASHLQKYRLYLKRLSTAASQGSMAAAIGSRSSYANLTPLNGYRNYHALGGSRQLPALTSLKSHGVLGRMNNNPPGLGKHGSLPSQAVQFGDMLRNSSNSFTDFRKLQSINLPGNHQGTLFPRVPTTVESKTLQQSQTVQEVKSQLSPTFSGVGVASGLSSKSVAGVPNNPLMLRPDQQLDQSGGLSNTFLARVLNADSFKTGAEEFPQISNLIGCNNTWPGVATSTGVSSNPLSMLGQISSNQFSPGNNINSLSSLTLHNHNSPLGDPLCGMASAPQQDPLTSNQCLTGSTLALAKCVIDKDQFSNLTILDNSRQKWDDTFHSDHISRTSSSSSFPDVLINDTTAEYQMSESDLPAGQVSFDTMAFDQNCAVGDRELNYRDEFAFECSGWKSDLGTSGCSLDELVNSMIKQEQDDDKQIDADLGSDMYNLDDEESEPKSGDGKER